jgi:hypothetical protein
MEFTTEPGRAVTRKWQQVGARRACVARPRENALLAVKFWRTKNFPVATEIDPNRTWRKIQELNKIKRRLNKVIIVDC